MHVVVYIRYQSEGICTRSNSGSVLCAPFAFLFLFCRQYTQHANIIILSMITCRLQPTVIPIVTSLLSIALDLYA